MPKILKGKLPIFELFLVYYRGCVPEAETDIASGKSLTHIGPVKQK